jgi:hypothetical protein
MSTVSRSPRPVKAKGRKVHKRERQVECEPAGHGTGADYLVRIWQDGKLHTYWLRRLATDYGVGFQFQQSMSNPLPTGLQLEAYDVLSDGEHGSCECPGHLRWSVECRHLWALRELIRRGDIPAVRPDHPSTDSQQLAAYKPASHDHGIPF